jgi:hypothetical protein
VFKIEHEELEYHLRLSLIQENVEFYATNLMIHGNVLFTRGQWPTDIYAWDLNTGEALYRLNESISILQTTGSTLDW